MAPGVRGARESEAQAATLGGGEARAARRHPRERERERERAALHKLHFTIYPVRYHHHTRSTQLEF